MAGAGIHPFPPPPVPGAPDAAVRPGSDEVRTIFITGLPVDVKERELHNLLRWLPGFEASQINFKGDQPMGFALFSYAHHAIAAKAALQDLVFDAETKSALHIEMAKKNLFIKRGVGTDANAMDQSKRLRTGGDYTHSTYAPPPFHPPPPAVSMWGTAGYMAAPPPYNPYAGYPVPTVPMASPSPVPGPTAYAPVQVINLNLGNCLVRIQNIVYRFFSNDHNFCVCLDRSLYFAMPMPLCPF
ncbi:RNA-binding protein with multiple splicing-like [Triticum urartu]|uniref:RNA-binding protein with multiple splicing-like n=1 Tax=Triticum urartu TaxID=4572 RepID=UPI00204388D8|nr:RNA-binding protein with multiple splicing-like [Triticum urartu]